MKLALGTAQFGLPYGIANQSGQVPLDEVAAILSLARGGGVDTLDTAIGYGDSEQRLGQIGVGGWRIVSKLPAVPAACADVAAWCEEQARGSLSRLCVPQLDALLLHRPAQLANAGGAALWMGLERLKRMGLTRKIGVSIYGPAELEGLTDRFSFDLIQAPFNVLDRRLRDSGALERLARAGVEWHARSAFLQGLLILPPGQRPRQFSRWDKLFDAYEAWAAMAGASRAEACLRFALAQRDIAKVVVGVESVRQLEQLLAIARSDADVPAPVFPSGDPDLIDPSRWAPR